MFFKNAVLILVLSISLVVEARPTPYTVPKLNQIQVGGRHHGNDQGGAQRGQNQNLNAGNGGGNRQQTQTKGQQSKGGKGHKGNGNGKGNNNAVSQSATATSDSAATCPPNVTVTATVTEGAVSTATDAAQNNDATATTTSEAAAETTAASSSSGSSSSSGNSSSGSSNNSSSGSSSSDNSSGSSGNDSSSDSSSSAAATSTASASDCVGTVTVTVDPTDAASSTAAAATTSAASDDTAATTTSAAATATATTNLGDADFGSCTPPSIEFGAGFDNRKETAFQPTDKTSYNHGSAQNIGIIVQFECDSLVNTCAANQAAKDLCAEAKTAVASADPKAGATADLFNSFFGETTNFADVQALDDKGAPVGGTASATGTAATASSTATLSDADFGSCTPPQIEFATGFDGRKETSFQPTDKASFNHGSAQNINIIVQFECDTLTNTCGANQAAKDICAQAEAAVAALNPKQGSTADAFNAFFGETTNFADVQAIDDQGNPVAARKRRSSALSHMRSRARREM